MKKLILTIALSTVLGSFASAGGKHFHPKQFAKCAAKACTEDQIKEATSKAIPYLAEWKKIDASWATAKIETAGQKQFKKGPEWMVTLKNDANETRYVFFSLDGFVTGSNATGN